MSDLVFSLPPWGLALLLNAWLVGFSVAGAWAFRRWVLPRLDAGDDADLFYSAAVLQSAMVLYALVAALTAVSVWNRHSAVGAVVSSEATAIAILWRDLDGYPVEHRGPLQATLRDYTTQIIEQAWPEQRAGRVPAYGVEYIDRLQAQLYRFEPGSQTQGLLHAKALDAYNELIQARRNRLDAVGEGLPAVMWFVLLPGAMGCLALSFFFRIRDARLQYVLVAGLSGFVAMVLFVIVALDQPFRGAMGIGSESYELIRAQLMHR